MTVRYVAAEREGAMFSRWGAFVYRFRRPIVVFTIALAVLSSIFAVRASEELSSGGWLDPTSESSQVSNRLATEFSAGRSNLIALFRSSTVSDAASPQFQALIAQSLAGLQGDPRVAGIVGFAQTGDRRFVSTRGDAAYVLIQLTITDEQSVDQLDGLRARITPPAGTTVQLTGYGPVTKDSASQSEKDLQKAEAVSLPLAAIILIAVFASLVGAGLPLLVAGLAIPSALALIYFAAQATEMSIYVLNIATMLGLALAIDYSLFEVSRFREELKRGRSVAEAVERAVATSGKAITFSGIAVAIGLSGLLFFTSSAIMSIGIAGSIVVLCSVFYGLTFLPAVLGMLGPRVNALSVAGLFERLRRAAGWPPAAVAARRRQDRWERVAHAVMRRPIPVLVIVLGFLLALGSPFLRLQQGVPDASLMPAGLESRDAFAALLEEFPKGETTPITILATVNGDPTNPQNALLLARYADEISKQAGIDRVESPFNLRDPATGAALTPEQVAAVYALPSAQRPPALQLLVGQYVRGSTVRIDAVSPLEPAQPAATNLIPKIRAAESEGLRVQVGGSSAIGYDFLASQAERAPWAVIVTLLASAIVLFLLFGSIVIPVKAVVMTLLSITASFGALVWIFQEGNLSNILNFDPIGFTIAGNPIIMFSVIFGLSMDYEVLLLSRIQEAYRRTGDNTQSVAEGLAKTAGVITGAALVMVSVFAAFALADTVTIKSIGVGMAIAVLVDATIIRVLLVPATMRLMGRWNWWAPGFLGRLAERLGFSHVEDDSDLVPIDGTPTLAPSR
jgi:RND superfamily putative drug exporter